MPQPKLRTRTKKRKRHSLPGGSNKTFYKKEKTGDPKCANCGRSLSFLPRSSTKIRKVPKSQKRISRAYGGQLCHICLRNLLKEASRAL